MRDLTDPGAGAVLERHGRYWRNGQPPPPEPWTPTATFAPADSPTPARRGRGADGASSRAPRIAPPGHGAPQPSRSDGGRGADDASSHAHRIAPPDSRPLFQLGRATPLADTPDPHPLRPPEPLDGAAFRAGVERGFDDAGLLDGDYFRCLGTGIASEVLVGCPMIVRAGTLWAEPCFTDFRQLDGYRVGDTVWFRRLIDNAKRAVDSVDSARYPFGSMAFRGPVDMAEAMMGGPVMCEAAVDAPGRLRHLLERITDVIIEVGLAHSALMPRVAGGQFSSYRIWTPGRTITLTLDGACLFSPALYEELFLPCDRRLCAAFETPFVHLHAAARQHFEAWTEIPNLGLQCVVDQAWLPEGRNQPIGPQVPELMPAFERIRTRKSLMLYGYWTAEWLALVRDRLPASGCAITGMAEDPEALRGVWP